MEIQMCLDLFHVDDEEESDEEPEFFNLFQLKVCWILSYCIISL